jgi:DNA (cytosine-5)-methyltransferase 1
MIGVDVFSGAGGMSLGARWAGIDVRVAIEMNTAAALTHANNHQGCLTINGDVRHISDIASSQLQREELVLFGGPPCQAFSTSNQRTRGPKNERNYLYREFLRLTRRLRPKWVVFENVPGILERRSKPYVDDLNVALRRLNYGTSSGVLNAMDFGVPQNRNRFFLIAALGTEAPSLPVSTSRSHITVDEAIHDLPVLSNGASICTLPYKSKPSSRYARKMRGKRVKSTNNLVSNNASYVVKRYKYIPPGGNWSDIPGGLMRNYADPTRCHTGIYHRLRGDEPSVVIGNFRKNMLIHPAQDRGLSVREAARLQSFPDSYIFYGSIGQQQQQVGNAVPPLLALAVFRAILRANGSGPLGNRKHLR